MRRALLAALLASSSFAACRNTGELLKADHMDIGVRFQPHASPYITVSAVAALNYWSSVLDMSWHVDQTDDCSLALEPHNWHTNQIGGAYFPWSPLFNGVLYYSNVNKWAVRSLFVHEIGHMMGLNHSDDKNSVMQPFPDESSGYLVASDATVVFQRHKRR